MAKLYLIPNLLGDTPWQMVLPANIPEIVSGISLFIVENTRNARRFLKKINPLMEPEKMIFLELNKHTSQEEASGFITPLLQGRDAGLISEAGCPGVADPGAEIVRLAHRHQIEVVPLVGPSSILLALMASGMNGQQFAFSGYLPVKQSERMKKIREIEKTALTRGQTQIFMETPYRNNQILSDIVSTCQPGTFLCIAADLTTEREMISTRRVSEWKKQMPDLDKRPSIFLLGSERNTR